MKARTLMTDIRYITINETYRIEVMPSGGFYPQHVVNPQLTGAYRWGYSKIGNKQRCFKTEKGARTFIASWK